MESELVTPLTWVAGEYLGDSRLLEALRDVAAWWEGDEQQVVRALNRCDPSWRVQRTERILWAIGDLESKGAMNIRCYCPLFGCDELVEWRIEGEVHVSKLDELIPGMAF